jgi:hypothetical protein
MGEILTLNYSILRADRTSGVHERILEEWDVHATCRGEFNAIDIHNNTRGSPISFEDTCKTYMCHAVCTGVSHAYGNGRDERILAVAEVQAMAWGLHARHVLTSPQLLDDVPNDHDARDRGEDSFAPKSCAPPPTRYN